MMNHTTPALGADLATERLRDLLTAAGNASFECGAHDCDGDAGDPAPYAELARIAAEKRAEIVEFFRASFAAVPASEPVPVRDLLLEMGDGVAGAHLRTFGKCINRERWAHIADSVLAARVPLYAAAPAPVSGMPDLACRVTIVRNAFGQEKLIQWAMLAELPQGTHDLFILPSPQAPDTPVAPVCQSCNGAGVIGTPGMKCPFCPVATPLPAAPAPTEQPYNDGPRLSIEKCIAQFRMYAETPTHSAAAKHQLNFCADFLRDHGPVAALPTEQAGELPPLPKPRHRDLNAFADDQMEDYARAALAARPAPTEAPKEPLSEAQLDHIARSYFAEPHAQENAKNAIHDAFLEARQAPDSRDAALVIPSHLREFVEAVAHRFDAIDRETDDEFCKGCSGLSVWDEDARQWITHHRPDCIVLRAEAILAKEKAQ